MTYAPREDSDQPEHTPSLIRVFAVCFMGIQGPKVSQGGHWSEKFDFSSRSGKSQGILQIGQGNFKYLESQGIPNSIIWAKILRL